MSVEPWTPPADMPGIDRTPDKHVSFLFEAELRGGHVHVKVRAATRHPSVQVNHSRGLCGTLIMEPGEWLLLRSVLLLGFVLPPDPIWVMDDIGRVSCRKIGAAGPGVSDDGTQQFIEFKGWPE